MSGLAQNLAGKPGCAVDGSVAARNPLGQVVDTLLIGSRAQHHNGRMGVMPGGPMGPGADIRAGMQNGFHGGPAHLGGARAARGVPMGDAWVERPHLPRHQMPAQASAGWAGEAAAAAAYRQASSGTAWASEAAMAAAGPAVRQRMLPPNSMSHHPRPPMMRPMGPMMGPPMMAPMPRPMMHPAPAYRPAHHVSQPVQVGPPAQAAAVPQARDAAHGPDQSTAPAQKNEPVAPTEQVDEESGKTTREGAAKMVEELSQHPQFQNSEFLSFMEQISRGDLQISGNNVVPGSDQTKAAAFREAVEREVAATAPAATAAATAGAAEATAVPAPAGGVSQEQTSAQMSKLEERLSQAWQDSLNGKDVDLDAIWDEAMREQQGAALAGLDGLGDMMSGLGNFADHGIQFGGGVATSASPEYEFRSDNPYMNQPNMFEKGMELFRDGAIDDAIQAFQAFVQYETDDSSEGWRMLGIAHQEHDQDRQAIHCLERAVEEDPYNLEALLALGVSYVNELDSTNALKTLKMWVQHNPTFQGMKVQQDMWSDGSLMDEVMQLMENAQQHAVSIGQDDTDVQIVLGVLYNVSRDYDSAVMAFQTACNRRPDEYSLWNKLGATLANGSRSEAAIPAYHRALELKPKYARGRLNLGISHNNMQQYGEAARCYLEALRLNPDATHIWSYLRITFTCMERYDLVQKSEQRNIGLFDAEETGTW